MVRRRVALGAVLGTGIVAAAAATAIFTVDRGSGQNAPELQPLLSAIVESGAPGVIVLVRHGAHTRSFESGLANPAAHTPMRASDRFRIGSITKTFVATVV